MTGFLLDTNCISEIIKLQPHPRVVRWMDTADEHQLHLSVLALGEIRNGAARLEAGTKRTHLERWLEVELPERFRGRILPIGGRIADIWGAKAGQLRTKGITLPVVDGLVAATAVHHGLNIVTRNVSDFATWSVTVINPWEAN
jgi:predicted nucleic acid-binding protein